MMQYKILILYARCSISYFNLDFVGTTPIALSIEKVACYVFDCRSLHSLSKSYDCKFNLKIGRRSQLYTHNFNPNMVI